MRLTAIVATATAPLECLVWSVSSLILNSDLSKIDRIIVSINGPDSRHGSTELQDKKQKFLEDLVKLGYPISIMRTWSRVGFTQPFEMALHTIDTRHYLLMHDDTVVANPDWQEQAEEFFANTDAAYINPVSLAGNAGISYTPLKKDCPQTMALNSVEIDTSFVVCDSFKISKKWQSYYLQDLNTRIIPSDGYFSHLQKGEKNILFDDAHKLPSVLKLGHRPISDYYSKIHYKMGAWIHHDVRKQGFTAGNFRPGTIRHMERMSWEYRAKDAVEKPPHYVIELQAKIKASPLAEVYDKYVVTRPDLTEAITNLKVFICVLAYKREFINHLMRAWSQANHYGSKLALFHSYDAMDPMYHAQKEKLLAYKPDFYIPTKNPAKNPGTFELFRIAQADELMPDWDVIALMCDDQIPMHKDFLRPFLEEFLDPEVGMVGSQYVGSENYVIGNFRTSFFGLKKEVVRKFPAEFWTQGSRAQESGRDNYSATTRRLGYKLRQPPKYVPESIWDCDHGASSFLWSKYELQFREDTTA